MTRMLASVADLAEARLVLAAGVDIIDLKDPAAGSLGALATDHVARIVGTLHGTRPISATVGDLPMDPGTVRPAVAAMAATGVDFIKIGFFPGGDWAGVIRDLKPLARDFRLVAVLFGDDTPDLHWVTALAAVGFAGAMLDTRQKNKGSLRTICEPGFLRDFLATARTRGLLSGLAGSLGRDDVPSLLALQPDYLGFRGALCAGNRTGTLDPAAVQQLRSLVHASQAPSPTAQV